MAPPSRRLALAVLSLGLAAASHGAPRTVPLDDFGLPGAWQVYEWNSAPGSLGVGAQERSVWAWPRHKGDGLTDGPSAWGEVTLGR
jgi:hypothetical protein